MDSKIIVEKALKGEDYSKDLETLTDDEKEIDPLEGVNEFLKLSKDEKK